jgi:hypothetical protein
MDPTQRIAGLANICADASQTHPARLDAVVDLLQACMHCHPTTFPRDEACCRRLRNAVEAVRSGTSEYIASRAIFMRGQREDADHFHTRKDQCNTALRAIAPLVGWDVVW